MLDICIIYTVYSVKWKEYNCTKYSLDTLNAVSCILQLPSHKYMGIYASPSSMDAYRDRQLTTNFEFWVEIFCVPTCFHVRIPKTCLVCLSVPKKMNHPSFVINTSMEKSSQVLQNRNPKIWISFHQSLKFNFDLCWKAEITLASSISVLH